MTSGTICWRAASAGACRYPPPRHPPHAFTVERRQVWWRPVAVTYLRRRPDRAPRGAPPLTMAVRPPAPAPTPAAVTGSGRPDGGTGVRGGTF